MINFDFCFIALRWYKNKINRQQILASHLVVWDLFNIIIKYMDRADQAILNIIKRLSLWCNKGGGSMEL